MKTIMRAGVFFLGATAAVLGLTLSGARRTAAQENQHAQHSYRCDPESYGVKGDGTTDDTHALQSAIDACTAHGGGTLELRRGKYLIRPIVLGSNLTLRIDADATLLGSTNVEDYPLIAGEDRRQPLVTSANATNLTIEGSGTIDGQGREWWLVHHADKKAGRTRKPRPWLIDLFKTSHILVEGVTLKNSPQYNLVLRSSTDATVRNIKIFNPPDAANTDGIDPYSSHHVLIENVLIDTGDDDVAIKSGLPRAGVSKEICSDIVIRNSTFLHGHGLSIGSETTGGVRNVLAENIHFNGTTNGIRIKSSRGRGNLIQNAVYRNLTMEDVARPIVITEYYGGPETEGAQPVNQDTPHFTNFTIDHLTATGSKQAGLIVGLPESKITNVSLRNITIRAQTGLTIRNANVLTDHLTIIASHGPSIIQKEAARIR